MDIFLGNKVTTINVKNILIQRQKKLVKTPSDVSSHEVTTWLFMRDLLDYMSKEFCSEFKF